MIIESMLKFIFILFAVIIPLSLFPLAYHDIKEIELEIKKIKYGSDFIL